MPPFQTSAIVLRAMDYGEADRIVTFFTLDLGKIRGIAKSARKSQKRFGGGCLAPFSYIRLNGFENARSGLFRVEQCSLIKPFGRIREDLDKVVFASYIVELVGELTGEGEANKDLFDLTIAVLDLLEKGRAEERTLRIFESRLLRSIGLAPMLTSCTVCQRPLRKEGGCWFSIIRSGVVCDRCTDNVNALRPISIESVSRIYHMMHGPLESALGLPLPRASLEESKEVLPVLIRYHLGKDLLTRRFVEKIRSSGGSRAERHRAITPDLRSGPGEHKSE